MPRVLLNSQLYGNAWTAHFIQDDYRAPIGSRTRYFGFATFDALRSFVTRCQPEDATSPGSTATSGRAVGASSTST